MTRPAILMMLAYFTYRAFSDRQIPLMVVTAVFWIYFSYSNLFIFFQEKPGNDFFNAKNLITPEVQAHNTGVRHIYSTPEAYLQFYYEDYKNFNLNDN